MPTISTFFRILVRIFFRDIEKHKTPHIHADYQGENWGILNPGWVTACRFITVK